VSGNRIGRLLLAATALPIALAAAPLPERLVVLTFDDAVKSHFTVARPLLKKYGFGATFFVTEGFNFHSNKTDYMTWEEIRTLHDDGFEIGNHTIDHLGLSSANVDRLEEQLRALDEACRARGIPKPVSFAWPGNQITVEALAVLEKHGIVWGRRGGAPEYERETGLGFPYEPGRDHPLLIPSVGVPRPSWNLETFEEALAKVEVGSVAVLQFHGVPEGEHAWVNTSRELFEQYMEHLQRNGYRVIALRDLRQWVDPANKPADPWAIINQRSHNLREASRRQNR
jgi:peptidoglycan/xylan/chitin deacetylase (PgdA/CDA1 family)